MSRVRRSPTTAGAQVIAIGAPVGFDVGVANSAGSGAGASGTGSAAPPLGAAAGAVAASEG